MKTDSIVQQVRDARASIAAEFGYDISKYLVWIRNQTLLRKQAIAQKMSANTNQMNYEIPSDETELEVKIIKRGKKRVISGLKNFSAVEALKQAREQREF